MNGVAGRACIRSFCRGVYWRLFRVGVFSRRIIKNKCGIAEKYSSPCLRQCPPSSTRNLLLLVLLLFLLYFYTCLCYYNITTTITITTKYYYYYYYYITTTTITILQLLILLVTTSTISMSFCVHYRIILCSVCTAVALSIWQLNYHRPCWRNGTQLQEVSCIPVPAMQLHHLLIPLFFPPRVKTFDSQNLLVFIESLINGHSIHQLCFMLVARWARSVVPHNRIESVN